MSQGSGALYKKVRKFEHFKILVLSRVQKWVYVFANFAMASPKWRSSLLPTRRISARLQKDVRLKYALIGAAVALALVALYTRLASGVRADTIEAAGEFALARAPLRLFIAVGSAPGNSELRAAAREGWLRWGGTTVEYRFFTDSEPVGEEGGATWRALSEELDVHGDIVEMTGLAGGYGDKEHNAYGQRALYQLRWALQHSGNLTHFLRVDDDVFLCLHRLIYELRGMPRNQFFWGRYWCRAGRNRADESFMLFSRDVAALLADRRLMGKLIPFDETVTFGWNFGYLSWFLNLTVFDDQGRIDSQQGYLTEFMHGDGGAEVTGFCEKFLFAHHVRPPVSRQTFQATKTHLLYTMPRIKGPGDTCHRSLQSFLPARHSTRLPDIKIERVNAR